MDANIIERHIIYAYEVDIISKLSLSSKGFFYLC